MIIKDLGQREHQLHQLFSEAFDNYSVTDFSEFFISSILCEESEIIAHASLQKREFPCLGEYMNINSYLLGLVCVRKNYRRQGYGTEVVREVIDEVIKKNCIILLNCGENIVPFYEKLGFTLLSPKASYDRNGRMAMAKDFPSDAEPQKISANN